MAQDLHRALSFFQRSCDLGLESACADTGRLLKSGVLSSDPLVSATQAAGPLRKACTEADARRARGDACHTLGLMLVAGEGVPKDPELGFEAFQRGCRDGYAEACLEAGRAFSKAVGTPQDLNAAANSLGKGCSLKSAEACQELCELQCDQGQPHACERVQNEKWPWSRSCAMP